VVKLLFHLGKFVSFVMIAIARGGIKDYEPTYRDTFGTSGYYHWI